MFAYTTGIRPKPNASTRNIKVVVCIYIPLDAITNESRSNVINNMYAIHRTNKAIPVHIQDINKNIYNECVYGNDPNIVFKINSTVKLKIDDINETIGNGIYYYKTIEPFYLKTEEEMRNTTFKKWYTNGQIDRSIDFVNGLKHGLDLKYTRFGQLEHYIEYNSGKLNGYLRTYHATGFRDLDLHFLNNKKQGECRKWNSEGELIEHCIFDEDTCEEILYIG
jgi:antitoxin component YwqK of YwqJK toxin-antitoxin module